MFPLRLPEEINMMTNTDATAKAIQKGKESVNEFAKKIGIGGEWCTEIKSKETRTNT